MSFLLTNGYIHSASDPYATAMIIDQGLVTWLGDDDTASRLVPQNDTVEVIDLHGALVAPAFFNALALQPQADETSGTIDQSGEYLRTVISSAALPQNLVAYRPLSESTKDSEQDSAQDAAPAGVSAGVTYNQQFGPEHVEAALRQAADHNQQILFLPASTAETQCLLEVVSRLQSDGVGVTHARHRVLLNQGLSAQQIQILADARMSVTVTPSHQDKDTFRTPVATLLAEGVPVAVGTSSSATLWSGIRALLEHPDPEQRISARAGFTAATRTPLRALPFQIGQQWSDSGRLVPGATANLAIWKTDQLSVQSPDGRVAAWSTDARSGTPLLPVLDQETSDPELVGTMVNGEFTRGATA